MSASSAASSSLNRTRASVILVSALVAASSIYYLYTSRAFEQETTAPTTGLHRSNAVHRRRRRTFTAGEEPSTFLTDSSGDNDEDALLSRLMRPLTDGETVVDDQAYQDDYSFNTAPEERAGQNTVQLLFRVSEDATRRNAYVHRGCACNSCNMVPIRGIRYRCANCADFDLCEGCESQGFHNKTHIFYKVKVPAPTFGPRNIQPVWYTGDPDTTGRQLPKALITKLSRETGFERPELDAYWEQWTFMANTEWRDDPDDINLAMDRKTFERCLVPSGGTKHAAPCLIFDRMFAFYDTNKDDLIGFSEFLHGLAYRKKRDKWKKIFEGYDIDGNGYVDRRDFLRMFRSYYVLFRQMHRDVLEGMDEQQMSSTDAHRLVSGRQPLSGAFGADGRYPPAPDPRTGEGKITRSNGDLEISDGKGVINESSDDTGNREDVFRGPSRNPWGSSQSRNGGGYWNILVDPPGSVEQLTDVIRNANRDSLLSNIFDRSSFSVPAERDENGGDDSDSDSESSKENDENWPPTSVTVTDEDAEAVGGPGTRVADLRGERRAEATQHATQRERSQQEINERWKRRQFYTDEEEGGTAPADWKEDDDILAQIDIPAEGSKSQSRPSIHSRSSSKVRFAEELDDFDTRSNPSTSSRSVPERWGGGEIPEAEKDAGKEILYQVTQQAFNELLDPLFKEKEDAAIEAAETKADREKYRHIFDAHWFKKWARERYSDDEKNEDVPGKTFIVTGLSGGQMEQVSEDYRPEDRILDLSEVVAQVRQRSLSELLVETGYTVEERTSSPDIISYEMVPEPAASSSVSHSGASNLGPQIFSLEDLTERSTQSHESTSEGEPLFEVSEYGDGSVSPTSTPHATPPSSESSHRDPTLPQFRPTSVPETAPAPTTAEDEQAVEKEEPTNQQPDYTSSPEIFDPTSQNLSTTFFALDKCTSILDSKSHSPVPKEHLLRLWRADKAEKEKVERGGWGRIDYAEFERCVRGYAREDGRGNGMDYLGSWIEFCIP